MFDVFGRVGISLSCWKMFKVRFWMWFNKIDKAQRIILDKLEDSIEHSPDR